MNLKIKLKRFISFAIIATASCFYSCQEDFEENIMPYNKHTIKDISFKQASKIAKFAKANNKFMGEISSIKNDKNKSTSRFSDSGFAVDSSTVREITVGDYTSYTMSILKDEPNQAYFENLVLEINGNKLTEYLFRYTPSAITQIADHDSYIFNGEMNMVWHGQTTMFGPDGVLNDSNNNDGPGQTLNCLSVLLCNGTLTGGTGPVHIANPNCTKTFSVMQCTGGGGNIPFINYNTNSNSTNNQNSSQSGGSGSSNSEQPVITVPFIPCPTCPEQDADVIDPTTPCGKLKKLLQADAVTKSLKTLREKLRLQEERAFVFNINDAREISAAPQTNATGTSATMPISNKSFGVAHTHQEGTDDEPTENFPMLSPQDLGSVAISLDGFNSTYPEQFFFNMMVVSGATFAITPNNNNNLISHVDLFRDNYKMEKFNLKLKDIYKKIEPTSQPRFVNRDRLAKAFLEYMNSTNNSLGINFDISLYTIDDIALGTKIWKKIELDPTQPNGVKKTPCNQI